MLAAGAAVLAVGCVLRLLAAVVVLTSLRGEEIVEDSWRSAARCICERGRRVLAVMNGANRAHGPCVCVVDEGGCDVLETDEDRGELAMPLVLCRTGGGPLDDGSFLSGFRLGRIGALLTTPGVSAIADSIRPPERLQADLLAMACGFTMTVDPGGSADWLPVTFRRIADR
jgi:hypothetical protein